MSHLNFITEKSRVFHQFCTVDGSKYYNTHVPQPALPWRWSQSEVSFRTLCCWEQTAAPDLPNSSQTGPESDFLQTVSLSSRTASSATGCFTPESWCCRHVLHLASMRAQMWGIEWDLFIWTLQTTPRTSQLCIFDKKVKITHLLCLYLVVFNPKFHTDMFIQIDSPELPSPQIYLHPFLCPDQSSLFSFSSHNAPLSFQHFLLIIHLPLALEKRPHPFSMLAGVSSFNIWVSTTLYEKAFWCLSKWGKQ